MQRLGYRGAGVVIAIAIATGIVGRFIIMPSPGYVPQDKETRLQRAIWDRRGGIVFHGPSPDSEYYKARQQEAQRHRIGKVKALIAKGVNVDAKDKEGSAPLHLAAWWGYADVVEALVRAGADVSLEDDSGQTPLELAAREGHEKVANILLAAGARVDDVLTAACLGTLDRVTALLDANPGLATVNEGTIEWTPLHLAARFGKVEVADLLLRYDADVNAQAFAYGTPLHLAADNGNVEVAKLLLAHGADINARAEHYGNGTPLHRAAESGHMEVTEMLIAGGAQVNASDDNGWKPLHSAIYGARLRSRDEARFEIVELLVAHGADVNAEGRWSARVVTPLGLARSDGLDDIVDLLLRHGARNVPAVVP